MKIVVDVDGVLSNTHQSVVELMNTRISGLDATIEDITEWDAVIRGHKFSDHLFDVLEDKERLYAIPSIDGSSAGVTKLKDAGHEIVIVTHRSRVPLAWTKQWLVNAGVPFDALISMEGDKSVIEPDVFIDDYPDNFKNGLHHRGILFDRPWNRNHIPNRRAFNWNDVVGIVETWQSS